jgi:tRNA(fMet)-specific endonuclease VapC
VIARDRLVLLDTNVLLHILRGRAAGRWLLERFGLLARPEKPLVSVVSMGEMWRMAERRGWGAAQREKLAAVGSAVLVVDLEPAVVRGYGELGAYLDGRGVPIPQNDLWIASTAHAKHATLLTADRHFDALAGGGRLTREFVDPAELPR